DGDTAAVQMRPLADLSVVLGQTLAVNETGDPRTIRLVRGTTGWRLVADEYADEMKKLYPVGTDWAAVIAAQPPSTPQPRAQGTPQIERIALGSREVISGGVYALRVESTCDGYYVVTVEGLVQDKTDALRLALAGLDGDVLSPEGFVSPDKVEVKADLPSAQFWHTFTLDPKLVAGDKVTLLFELRKGQETTQGRLVVPLPQPCPTE
ncbi:MAG: hypothetical protein ACYC1C_20560, partial [Chloroflexota bacterium]